MYRKLIRDIQSAMDTSSLPVEFLVDLAQEYADACQTVNDRLDRVGRLLKEGNYPSSINPASISNTNQ